MKKANLKVVEKQAQKKTDREWVCLHPDETWNSRVSIINDSIINMMDTLIVVKDEFLKKELLTLNLEETLLLLQTLHLFLTRAGMALNIKKEKVVEAMMENEKGETFKHFLSLKARKVKGDFCARLLGNISKLGGNI